MIHPLETNYYEFTRYNASTGVLTVGGHFRDMLPPIPMPRQEVMIRHRGLPYGRTGLLLERFGTGFLEKEL